MPRLEIAALLGAIDRLDAPIDAWLVGVARAIYALRRGRVGVRLFTYEVDDAASAIRTRVLTTGEDFEIEPDAFNARMSPATQRAIYRPGARAGFVGDLLLRTPELSDHVRGDLERHGVSDVFNVHAADEDAGVALIVPSRGAAIGRPTAALLGRSAEQLRAGLRLRGALVGGVVDRDAALLTPAGEVEAIGDRAAARTPIDALRELVRARERALRPAAGEPDLEARASWLGLVRGEWSCVDLFEESGRRHVVVARSAPTVAAGRALRGRELAVVERLAAGASVKATALELGLREPEVSRTLARALARLGLRDRAALVRVRALLE